MPPDTGLQLDLTWVYKHLWITQTVDVAVIFQDGGKSADSPGAKHPSTILFSLQRPGQLCVRASLRPWSPERLRAPRWTGLSHPFPRMLAAQPGLAPGKEAQATKSASSGEGRAQGWERFPRELP